MCAYKFTCDNPRSHGSTTKKQRSCLDDAVKGKPTAVDMPKRGQMIDMCGVGSVYKPCVDEQSDRRPVNNIHPDEH